MLAGSVYVLAVMLFTEDYLDPNVKSVLITAQTIELIGFILILI